MTLRERILIRDEERDFVCSYMLDTPEKHGEFLNQIGKTWAGWMCSKLSDEELEAEYARFKIEKGE